MNGIRTNLAPKARLLLVAVLVLAILGSALAFATTAGAGPEAQGRTLRLDFHSAMRKLWEDHITWTRLYIVSTAADLPDRELVAQRLLQNQVDLGNAIKPYYGDEAGEQLTALLTDHILIAVEVLDAAKAGDTAAFDEALARWYANGNDIAEFLNAANPKNWPLNEMRTGMRMHLDLTLREASNRFQGNFAA
ncbi:MAG TPA: glycosyltransferase, partial [Anaerolineae bacterium]|nr:glycosyltransferase [Anaerolineae bacterium]